MNAVISILIATRNRCDELAQTLHSLEATRIPPTIRQVELIVIDNGSTDATPEVLRTAGQRLGSQFTCKWLTMPLPGKSRALNHGLAHATGTVLLFVDDDVRVPRDWIEPMTAAILADQRDAIAGGIRLADELVRPWMRDVHFDYLACTSHKRSRQEHPTVGANCAIAQRVFTRIPQFDPEVGPGAVGHAEDLLFWLQMRAAGFRLGVRFDVEVEHHPSAGRLTRSAFLSMAEKNGDWEAYVDYHWSHTPRRTPYISLVKAWTKLWVARFLHPLEWWMHPAAPEWELPLLVHLRFRRRYLAERRKRRNYERHGSVKAAGEVR